MTADLIAARDCDWYAELDRLLALWSVTAECGHSSHESIRDQIVAYCAMPDDLSNREAAIAEAGAAACYGKVYSFGAGKRAFCDMGFDFAAIVASVPRGLATDPAKGAK